MEIKLQFIFMKQILITGALGQIGSELTPALVAIYGKDQVITSDLNAPTKDWPYLFEPLDATNTEGLKNLIEKYAIDTIFHLGALLSASGEKNPQLCWQINMNGLMNVLETARLSNTVKKIIFPSSIAVFGPETPKENTPQETINLPKTMYGITKYTGELLCDYYVAKYGMDIRGIRYPGLMSNVALPGGGSTGYAVEIFYEAIKNKKYTCPLAADTYLPMMYMPDAIAGTILLAQAPKEKLKHHANFNFAAMSFCPAQMAAEIKKYIPDFEMNYAPDLRNQIASAWPNSIDFSAATEEWGFVPAYNLEKTVADMMEKITKKING